MPLPKPPARLGDIVEPGLAASRQAISDAPPAAHAAATPAAAPSRSKRPLAAILTKSAAHAPAPAAPAAKAAPVKASPAKAAPAPAPAVVEAPAAAAEPAPRARDAARADAGRPAAPLEAAKAARPAAPARTKSKRLPAAQRKLFVLDTNVLLHDPSSLFRFAEHDVFLPMIVLEELDHQKKGMSEVARNARQVSRALDELIATGDLNKGIPLDASGNKDALGLLYFQTRPTETRLPIELPMGKADNVILSIVHGLRQESPKREIVLVSKDINMRLKARALNLPAEDYLNDHVLDDSDLLYDGIMPLPENFWIKHGKDIESWQQNGLTWYRVRGPLCSQFSVNEFVYYDGDMPLSAQVREVTGKSAVLATLRDFSHAKNSVWGITARNREQNFALNLLMNPDIDFVSLLGQAGTGKTLLTLASALAQTFETKRYTEIIITRATVPVGDDIGFLPGTEEEKMLPWMGALEDNLEVLHQGAGGAISTNGNGQDWNKTPAMDLIRSRIKVKSLNFMRGRTFLNKFLIIDEAQNLTPKQMKTLITRAGPGTKIVCLGNIAQIDTPYLTEGSSGLTYVVDRFKGWLHAGHITLQRGERSRLADYATDAL
ncbi:PhoH family protein [uncultured Castellaniella sp.]|uniref:PhoH family protein n=1 Tax=uncultured Castellaniella sp. TaxID=647907 RepID=UPI00262F5818|nr:PhoH family protein [uncultured Castellaniella sp.]